VALVLSLALALRLWGSRFSLPYIYHPDEPVAVGVAVRMLQTGDVNPHFFHWGTGYFYVVAALYVLYYFVGVTLGIFHSLADLALPQVYALGVGRIAFPTEVWVARLVSVALGVGTVWMVYLIGRHHYSHKSGILAAALLATSPVHVAQSQVARPDATMTFFLTLSLLYALRAMGTGGWRVWMWAGFWGGLAAATKYNAALLVVFIICAAHCLRHRRKAWRETSILWAGGGAAIGFALGNPGAIIAPLEFWEGFTFGVGHQAHGHAGMEGDALLWYLYFLTTQGLLSWLALGYAVWGLMRREGVTWLIAIVALAYFAVISTYTVRNDRTILPIFPLLAVLAGVALIRGDDWMRGAQRISRVARISLTLAIVLLAFVPPLVRIGRADWNLTQKGVQTLAEEWIKSHIPPGSKIVEETYTALLTTPVYEVIYLSSAIEHSAAWYCEHQVDYVVMSEGAHGRLFADPDRYRARVEEFETLMGTLEFVHEVRGPLLGVPDVYIRIYRVPCDESGE
jgi:4-amino-4-deoxy-L-arabinose transferase-like glycosyltransferase